jgi:hypothetical protein
MENIMAISAHKRLAIALEHAQNAAINHIIQSSHLKAIDLKLLVAQGFLKQIIRGWYLLDADHMARTTGDSVLWQESYRTFLGQYLSSHFGQDYHLSPEDSLDIHTGMPLLPKGIIVYVNVDTRRNLELPGGLILQTLKRPEKYSVCQPIDRHGLRILDLPDALMLVIPNWYRKHPLEVQLALAMVDIQSLARSAVNIANLQAAGRIIGAYQKMGIQGSADYLQNILEQAGFEKIKYEIVDPLENIKLNFNKNNLPKSPYAGRIHALWHNMRETIIELFPPAKKTESTEKILLHIDDLYVNDAYHSLSIEGYRVTPELITKIREGQWNPDRNQQDKEQVDALAAKGYALAFQEVKQTVTHLLETKNNTDLSQSIARWYAALFSPCVQAGIIRAEDIAGYRNRPVYIRGSRHVPLPYDALRDAMETLFLELTTEQHPAVCAVMGHFLIGYIHPYPDGNGRMARFLMNALFSARGYPWTIIRLEERQAYMASLEKASCDGNIKPFVELILAAMKYKF